SLTAFLSGSPMQTIPSWDQTGTPDGLLGFFHLTSSTIWGSARLIRARRPARVLPLQPPTALILASISRELDATFVDALILAFILSSTAPSSRNYVGATKASTVRSQEVAQPTFHHDGS